MNNNKLVLLSRFAAQARRFIGVVNVTKMSTDHAYAIQTILSAHASKNADLKDLAKKVSLTLNINHQLLNAIEHFLNEYIETQDLAKVEYYLHQFAQFIYDIPAEGVAYRRAVSQYLAQLEEMERPFCTQMIRAFYPYWMAEFTYQGSQQLSIHSIDFRNLTQTPKSLLDLWEKAESELLSDAEMMLLSHFTKDMLEKEIANDAVDSRKKIAKILTVELRNHQAKTHFDYRLTVEKIQALINKHDLKAFFVQVSRDFYYFWNANADQNQHPEYSI
ncbi:hypothetical protein [Methylotenera sp. N17]|jgi:hypothetical protein|uniref:hypothetical protein n=1 Tax=Methylotenera sp. N17 TaxID=1502761 RepID=UPI000647E75C|nr:hypothetical protein [Methylotenera sp. N17]